MLGILKGAVIVLSRLVVSNSFQTHGGARQGMSSSRGSSQPRDQTQISHIEGRLYQLSHQGSPKWSRTVNIGSFDHEIEN